jgi:hypothetical protein
VSRWAKSATTYASCASTTASSSFALSRGEARFSTSHRGSVSPWLDVEQWAPPPAILRRKTLARILSEIAEAAARAARQGGFDGPESHVSRIALALDAAGTREIAALLDETREAALRIEAASAGRQAARGAADPPPIVTQPALMHLRHADTN